MKYLRLVIEYNMGLRAVSKQSCYDKMFPLFCKFLWSVCVRALARDPLCVKGNEWV